MAGCSFAPLSALSTVELTLPLEDSQPLHLIFVLNSVISQISGDSRPGNFDNAVTVM